ncbi:MAG: penicillin-binding protein 2 [Kiritimatiellae bacterium]|nr:penicillin-binding protein 2 [Kiritimatiellia bacterium]
MTDLRHTLRIFAVAAVIVVALGGLGARLAFLHLGPNDALREKVHQIRRVEREIPVGRGRILDRGGSVLAMDLAMKDVWADPKTILQRGHMRFIGAHLARLLELEPAVVLSRLNRPGREYEYIKRYVPMDVADRIQRMQLTGVHFDDVSARHYPQHELMCHVVGFCNTEGVGSAGLEQRLHKYLRGTPGLLVSERDGRRREMFHRRTVERQPQPGADVHLTLDQSVQYIVEKGLDRAVEEHHARGAWVVVQRVRTGEILAMACRPHFDLNAYRAAQPETMRNGAISYNYEPGSTFKVAVIAAALDRGVVSPADVFDCENGMWFYGGRSLSDYSPHGPLSVADIIKKSSNIGAAKVALKMGPALLEDSLREFGIGRRTGIDLPGEEAGLLSGRSSWTAISPTRIAMGHEVAVTSLQMLNVLAAIANDGVLLKPYVVQRIVDANGRSVFEASPEVLGRPIAPETAALMRALLTRVTEEGGTGTRAAVPGFKIAGKTGSAQKPIPGGYSRTAHMASFAGFFPADAPEIAMIVVIDEPQPLHTGGAVAAPVFSDIADQIIRCLNIVPPAAGGSAAESTVHMGDQGETS